MSQERSHGSARLDGVLVVDKPPGNTSHDIVAQARRYFGTRAVGHAGTLDPMATGVLVLLFGEGCKLSSHLTLDDKTYRTTVAFGATTNTLDADGAVTESRELAPGWLTSAALEAALAVESGRALQVPPSVSAIQSQGERAYARVRRGETVELEPRAVRVQRLELLGWTEREASFELTVSKGYYIRAFARDLGATLDAPAHLTALRRLASGAFTLDEATPWPPPQRPALLGVSEAARRALPVTWLTEAGAARARRGQRLTADEAQAGAIGVPCAWLAPDGTLVALGISSPEGEHRVARGFV